MAAGKTRDVAIGQAVVAQRGDRSQKVIANAMRERGHRWSQATVWSVEKGDRPLKFTEAVDLAGVLRCEVSDFLRVPAALRDEMLLRRNYEQLLWKKGKLEFAAVSYEAVAAAALTLARRALNEDASDDNLRALASHVADLAAKSPADIVTGPMEDGRAEHAAFFGESGDGVDS